MSAAARWLGYIGLFFIVGAPVFRLLATRCPGGAGERARALLGRTRRLGLAGAALLLMSGLLRLWFQAQAFTDPGAPVDPATFGVVVNQTAWGAGWRWQMGLALAAGLAFLSAGRWAGAWLPALLAGAGSAVAATLTGHALEHPWGAAAGIALHSIHLLGGSIWLGTLAALLYTIYGRGGEPPGEGREALVAATVNAYSPVALTAAAAAIGAGLLTGFNYVGTVDAAVGTDYGRMLRIKLARGACVAGLGAWTGRRVRPALGAAAAAGRLRRSAGAELLLGTLLLAATAVLVALPAPAL